MVRYCRFENYSDTILSSILETICFVSDETRTDSGFYTKRSKGGGPSGGVTEKVLDDVDRRIVALLQENARYPAVEIADRVGVSDNTVHNRIDRLEDAGVLDGYVARLDHQAAGLEFHFLFVCTVRISERRRVADTVVDLPGVVEVTELMTGRRNLHIQAVGADDDDITRLARALDGHDLEIEDEVLVRTTHAATVEYDDIDGLDTGSDGGE